MSVAGQTMAGINLAVGFHVIFARILADLISSFDTGLPYMYMYIMSLGCYACKQDRDSNFSGCEGRP